MIPHREILALRTEWGLRADVIEKDYALGWLLAGIAAEPVTAETWIFKGGTCARKCYYETYRFSEDLDFTVVDRGPEEPEDLQRVFRRIARWLHDSCGMELLVDESSFARRRNRRGNATTRGRLAFRGPSAPPSLPKVNLDITSDELLVDRPVLRPVAHPYSDETDPATEVACYSAVELLAEKLRALAERCRPRDLYDVVHLHRHPDLLGRAREVRDVLAAKCSFVGIDVPTRSSIDAAPGRSELESEWANMLEHQLPSLPAFDAFWFDLEAVFGWLTEEISLPVLEPISPREALDTTWTAPQTITTWRAGAPLELIRFGGANRLRVVIDYYPEVGRIGPRKVEPYSLKRTRDGNLLLYVINDYGQLRSYRVDRIRGVQVTRESFVPQAVIEF